MLFIKKLIMLILKEKKKIYKSMRIHRFIDPKFYRFIDLKNQRFKDSNIQRFKN